MRRNNLLSAIAGIVAILGARASLAQPAPAAAPELRVGVFEAPPYSMKNEKGEWRGLTVELWKRLATQMGARYRFVPTSEDGVLEALASGGLDTAAGPISATLERQRVVDFSLSYLETGLAMAVRRRGRVERLVDLFRTLFASEASHVLTAIGVLTVLFGALVWLVERRRNPQFPNSPPAGVGAGVWWAGVTTAGVGYGDKVPITVGGRLLALLWMLISIVLIVVLTASMTASLATAEFARGAGVDALRHLTVGALDGSASADFLRRSGVERKLYPSFDRTLDALARHEVDAVMFTENILRYYAARAKKDSIELVPQVFMPVRLAFPLPDGSPIRAQLNRALRETLANPDWRDLRDTYLGPGKTVNTP
ncbi:MAG TPA: transporter substrate-binding domain-containing protein [Thermoanaerobaculia bacterium]